MKKIAYTLFMLLIISFVSFIAINLAPHSFLAAGNLNPNITPEALEQLKSVYGLDKPLLEQYFGWLISIATFDFGVSFVNGQQVSALILERIPITLVINISAMFLVFFVSLYLGIKAALKKDSVAEESIKQASLVSFAMPGFYLAILLVLFLSYYLDLFPINGLHSSGKLDGLAYYLDSAWHLVLPIFVAVFGAFGSLTLYIRSLTSEILKSDYYFFAKARGLDDKTVFRFYILPNLAPPIVTMLGLSLPGLIGGSVILETIFAIDGMGLLFYNSALSRDYPVIMGILIIGAFLTLLGNILADMVLLKLNPYFKKAKSG